MWTCIGDTPSHFELPVLSSSMRLTMKTRGNSGSQTASAEMKMLASMPENVALMTANSTPEAMMRCTSNESFLSASCAVGSEPFGQPSEGWTL